MTASHGFGPLERMSFSLIELQLLAGLSEGRTLSDIADQLHFTQSAMSKVLHAAESHSDMALVEHRGRRLQLTAAGAEIGRNAHLVLAQLHGLDQLVEDLRLGKKGTLRIAATMTPSDYVLPAALGRFRELHAGVDLTLRTVSGADWRILVNEGLDLGIGTRPTAPPGWTAELLYMDRVTLFAAGDSRWAEQGEVEPAELRDQLVIAPWGRPYWQRVLEQLAERGIDIPLRLDIQPMSGVKRLVEARHGLGALLESAVRDELRSGSLARLCVAGAALDEPFYLIRPDVRRPLEIVEAFCRCLRAEVAAMVRQPPSP
jgi:DNA-binding transcriptional LysR family regulator